MQTAKQRMEHWAITYQIAGEEAQGLNYLEFTTSTRTLHAAQLAAKLPPPPEHAAWHLALVSNDARDARALAPTDELFWSPEPLRVIVAAVAPAGDGGDDDDRALPPPPTTSSPQKNRRASRWLAKGLSAAKSATAAAARVVDAAAAASGGTMTVGTRKVRVGAALDETTRRRTFVARDVKAAEEFSLTLVTCDGKDALRAVRREVELLAAVGRECRHCPILAGQSIQRDGPKISVALLGRPFIALATERLPESRIPTVLRGVAAALAHMHSRDVAHGDVGPRSVGLQRDGEALLADFSCSRSPCAHDTATREACMALSATLVDAKNRQCQAPEVASLKPGGPPVDARADVYAFGSWAHVVATGAPPRNGTVDAALPGRLAGLLREALASDVDGRPESATLLAKCQLL